jgi:TonB family protein
VRGKIWSLWVSQVRPDAGVSAIVEFTILSDGSLVAVSLAESSGVALIDFAAQRAVLSAAPFAPLPKDLGQQPLRIRAIFKGVQ